MPKATKIVVYFDDGSTWEIPADSARSIYLNEGAATKCGHKPPYNKPPKKEDAAAAPLAAMSTTGGGGSGGNVTLSAQGETCYLINGVIVCP